MTQSMKRVGRLILVGVAVLAIAAPAQAKGAVATTITLISAGPVEPFTTTGGALCPVSGAGVASSFDFRFAGSDHGRAGTFHLKKTLVCSDGSGSLTIKIDAATVFGSPTDQGGWSIVEGTGDYANAHGGGSLVGTYFPDFSGITDLYTGRISL